MCRRYYYYYYYYYYYLLLTQVEQRCPVRRHEPYRLAVGAHRGTVRGGSLLEHAAKVAVGLRIGGVQCERRAWGMRAA